MSCNFFSVYDRLISEAAFCMPKKVAEDDRYKIINRLLIQCDPSAALSCIA